MEEFVLPAIQSFEEFEALGKQAALFEQAAQEIIRQHALQKASLRLFADGTNVVYAYGDDIVIKIFPPCHQNQYQSEYLVLQQMEGQLSVPTPRLLHRGMLSGWPYIVMTQLEGVNLEGLWDQLSHANKQSIFVALGGLIQEAHQLDTDGLEVLDCHWEQFIAQQIQGCVARHRANGLAVSLVEEILDYIASADLPQLTRPVLLTGEYTPMNFLVKKEGDTWEISGLMDFGDAMLGLPAYDLLGPIAFLVQGDKVLLRTFLEAYGYAPEAVNSHLAHQLMALMLLHQYSNLGIQLRIPQWHDKAKTLEALQDLVFPL